MAAHPRQLLQHAARASVAVHFLATTASNSSGVNCTDIGTPGCEDLPSTAAIVGGARAAGHVPAQAAGLLPPLPGPC